MSITHCIFGQRGEDIRFPITISIGEPYLCHEEPEEWACPVSLVPLHQTLADIHGEDALQALCLAIRFAFLLLRDLKEKGGRLLHADDSEWPLEAYDFSTNEKPSG